jgi:hypothetical protein
MGLIELIPLAPRVVVVFSHSNLSFRLTVNDKILLNARINFYELHQKHLKKLTFFTW